MMVRWGHTEWPSVGHLSYSCRKNTDNETNSWYFYICRKSNSDTDINKCDVDNEEHVNDVTSDNNNDKILSNYKDHANHDSDDI